MLKGFKEFLLRGNVIDLAVAVVVGAAFSAIVTAFTGSIIQPLINSLGGTDAAQGLGFTIRNGNPSTFVDFGTLITAALNFLIIASVVYFVIVMPFEKLKALRAKAGDDAAALTEAELLTEIRDLLAGKDPKEAKQKAAADESSTTAFPGAGAAGSSQGDSPLDRSPNISGQFGGQGQGPAPQAQRPQNPGPQNQPPQQPYPGPNQPGGTPQYGQPGQGGGYPGPDNRGQYGQQYGQPGGPGEYRQGDYPPPGYRPDGPGRHEQ
ncbi:large-conductance mechanosensitive channel protein MscL [Williamsia sp.]|uniref:large-conductance mechanosensitive channel protein MscL n=1 Tax=Williamsia sp. TaxID=1872085 RepID=UPI001A2538A0|nr:large-conductance mechanosensitive channel protein MscL [Williamsia sp.]MBJ7290957.1 large-conductance mechanosensitive channel protein MscL [Williamsia sp.]